MSLQDEEPQEPEQEMLQQVAARIIQRAWRRYVFRVVFEYFKELIGHCNQQDPQTVLKTVNPREAELLDAAAGVFIRFRLGGITFPPNIYYKIFTHRPITDVCANSPRDYTKTGVKKPMAQQTISARGPIQEDRSGWYQRIDNNSWRLFCSKADRMGEPAEIGTNKKIDFHYSRVQRKQDVDKWRKRRKIEWLRLMYRQGRLQAHPEHRHMENLVEISAQEVMDTIKRKGDDEICESEVDELLAWTNALNFEEYMHGWRQLGCSHSSELSRVFREKELLAEEESRCEAKLQLTSLLTYCQHRENAAEMATLKTNNGDDWIASLIQESHKAKEFSYCPYSQLRVGSALLTEDGKIFTGCNVEDACFYLGLCAERAAINKAVSEGYKKFKAIAISSDLEDRVIPPCGACRQVIKEFGDMPVFMTKVDESYTMMTMEELLPLPWGAECLNK